jgi:asparagine synthase (glutamine-hydrolysing)
MVGQRADFSMIAGWLDLSRDLPGAAALAEALRVSDAAPGTRRVSLPGLEIETSGPDADLAISGGLLVACTGLARFRDERAKTVGKERGQAAGWLELFKAQRADALSRVSGEYAVVLLDVEARSALLACDRFAIRPLCYSYRNGRIAFADRADRVATGEASRIDPQAIYDYLYFHVIPTPRTIFQDVARLGPAGRVRLNGRGTPEVGSHWMPVFEEPRSVRFDDLKHELRTLLREAVAREAGNTRVGAFLSGGTDSSTVTGMLKEATGEPPPTYSIGFDAEGYDEMAYARIAARHFGARHREYYLTPDDLVRGIPQVAEHYDQPFGNSSALPAYYCASVARSEGIDKLLAGDGGDELFGGNTRYATQRVFQAYYGLPQLLRRGVIEPMLIGNPIAPKVPLVRKASRYVQLACTPMPDRMNTYNLLEWCGITQVLEKDFVSSVDTTDPARRQRDAYNGRDGSMINSMLAYDWKYTLADNDLPKVCRTAGLAGIAVAFPLLADEIVDFSVRLPTSLKVRGLRLRYFFKEALRGFLPDAILTKKKHGFGLPFGPWFMRHQPLRELAMDSVSALTRRGIVRREFTDKLVSDHMKEHAGYFGEMIWILMMLERWLARQAPGFAVAGR